jgi:hypothetical protein
MLIAGKMSFCHLERAECASDEQQDCQNGESVRGSEGCFYDLHHRISPIAQFPCQAPTTTTTSLLLDTYKNREDPEKGSETLAVQFSGLFHKIWPEPAMFIFIASSYQQTHIRLTC